MTVQISTNQNNIDDNTDKPLGIILLEAGLISDYQIQVALQDQEYNASLLFGEILALRGWIQQETADFFAVELPKIQKQGYREKIGYYLKQANLLNDQQIKLILQEQKNNLIRFGSIAVLKGYLKQKTLDFLVENLFSHSSYVMTFTPQENNSKKQQNHNNTQIQTQETYIQSTQGTYSQSNKKEDLDKIDISEIHWAG